MLFWNLNSPVLKNYFRNGGDIDNIVIDKIEESLSLAFEKLINVNLETLEPIFKEDNPIKLDRIKEKFFNKDPKSNESYNEKLNNRIKDSNIEIINLFKQIDKSEHSKLADILSTLGDSFNSYWNEFGENIKNPTVYWDAMKNFAIIAKASKKDILNLNISEDKKEELSNKLIANVCAISASQIQVNRLLFLESSENGVMQRTALDSNNNNFTLQPDNPTSSFIDYFLKCKEAEKFNPKMKFL